MPPCKAIFPKELLTAFGMSFPVNAGETIGIPHRVSCAVVRYYVAKYAAPAAEAYARSNGATVAEIEAARRCMRPDYTARTASVSLR